MYFQKNLIKNVFSNNLVGIIPTNFAIISFKLHM